MSTAAIDLSALEPVAIACDAHTLTVALAGGAQVVTPLAWYPRLAAATPAERARVELMSSGVHWPDIDEDLSVEGMLRGCKAKGGA